MLEIAQLLVISIGIVLVLFSLVRYLKRTQNWHAVWQVWVGKLNDLNYVEFRLYRSGIAILFVGILLRIIFLTLSGL